MKSKTQPQFWELYDKLPQTIKKSARKQFAHWNDNHQHPSLNFKRVGKNPPIYSVRVTHTYRALGVVKNNICYWFWIGHHDEYDKLVGHMK